MQKCHHIWKIPKNFNLPVCLYLLFSIWALDSLFILTTTSCFLLQHLNCKQQNLKTGAVDPKTEVKLEDSIRNSRSEFGNEKIKSKHILKHLYKPVRQKLPNPAEPKWDLDHSYSLSLTIGCHCPLQPSRAGAEPWRTTCQLLLAQQSNLLVGFRAITH